MRLLVLISYAILKHILIIYHIDLKLFIFSIARLSE